MSAAWPLIKRRLVEHLPNLPGWSQVAVYDGPPVTGDSPTDFVTVGFVRGEDFAGSYEQTPPVGPWSMEEAGTLRSELVCATGDTDLPGMELRAFALVDAWQEWVTADPKLGVLNPSSTASLAVDVQPQQTTAGAVQRLVVTVSYLART